MSNLISRLSKQLQIEEGVRLRLYRDPAGKLSIGMGHNIEDLGISATIADLLAQEDITNTLTWLGKYAWFETLDEVRQAVVADMCYNLGPDGLLHFPTMLHAIQSKLYAAAADAMVASKWYTEVGTRAVRLVAMMRSGEWAADIPYS